MGIQGKWLVAALALLMMATASAEGAGATVKVGKFTKIARGTILQVQGGDISCYVELKSDAGKTLEERASFEMCETQDTVGKRVELTWRMATLRSPECAGDMDCKLTIMEPIIASMKVIGSSGTKAAPKAAATPRQTSYCTPSEQVVFACQMGKKLVSVCADPKSTAKAGMLQYRFGNPAEPVLELMWPESYLPPSKVASGTNFPLAGGGGAWLRIPKGDHAYVVYTAIGKFGPGGAVATRAGLTVERKGKPIAQLKCTSKEISELGPDWFEKVGITDQNQDFDLPE